MLFLLVSLYDGYRQFYFKDKLYIFLSFPEKSLYMILSTIYLLDLIPEYLGTLQSAAVRIDLMKLLYNVSIS